MEYSEFLGQVQNRLELDSQQAAIRATRVTLETLGARLDPGEADDLASQLPEEIGIHLTGSEAAESFGWQEFVDRVAEGEGLADEDDRADAAYHAQVVVDVVADAVSTGELADVVAQLPDEFDDLFELVDDDQMPA